jgi:integrase
MPDGIQIRGPDQFRAQVRRNGVQKSKTFKTLREAQQWRRVTDGKASANEFVDLKQLKNTTLRQACDWMLEGSRAGVNANAKNIRAKLRYWKTTELATWSMAAIHDWDLIEWRRAVLDEDNAEDGEVVGAGAECGPQSVIHRLNALSKLLQTWSRAHRIPLVNPVSRGVRPPKPDGRDRRLREGEEEKLLAAAATSSRSWLKAAIIISIESCVRQTELATLSWDRVRLDVEYPYFDLPKTKNDRPRRVPLSVRSIEALRSLLPVEGRRHGSRVSRFAMARSSPRRRFTPLRTDGFARPRNHADHRPSHAIHARALHAFAGRQAGGSASGGTAQQTVRTLSIVSLLPWPG